jgi:hypothetical protein
LAVLEDYANMWEKAGWLEPNESIEFKRYGYYSKVLKLKDGRVFDKTRIIAINTMSCYYFNFEGLKTRYDPGD